MNVSDQALHRGLSTKEKIKIIIILAFPAVIENFFQTMLGFADTFFCLSDRTGRSIGRRCDQCYISHLLCNLYGDWCRCQRVNGKCDWC